MNMKQTIEITLQVSDRDNDNLGATIITKSFYGTLGTLTQNTDMVKYTPKTKICKHLKLSCF
jgi:hypothetical protein